MMSIGAKRDWQGRFVSSPSRDSAHTLKIYQPGALVSMQQKLAGPLYTAALSKTGIGRGGDSGSTAGDYVCTDGFSLQWEGATIYSSLP